PATWETAALKATLAPAPPIRGPRRGTRTSRWGVTAIDAGTSAPGPLSLTVSDGTGGATGVASCEDASGAGERRLLGLYGAMAAMGAAALMLGLWLAGSA
ncbi:MAG: hypothetical protein ACXWML_06365, partial [Candidatus Binataceae bacterium]